MSHEKADRSHIDAARFHFWQRFFDHCSGAQWSRRKVRGAGDGRGLRLAYCVGQAIRFNIKNAEPLIEINEATKRTTRLERSSDLALVAAYVISVCLYINILASFLLGGIGEQYDTIFNEHIVSIAIISAIGLIGYFKGLDLLERLVDVGLWVTLLIVGALFVGFGAFDLKAAAEGIQWPSTPSKSWWEIITIVGGTLIVVQGFETSRYFGRGI